MANYLLIGGRFDLDVSAGSICIRNIAFELKNRGHNIHAITNSWDKDDYQEKWGMKIHGIKDALYTRIIEYSKNKRGLTRVFFKIFSLIRYILLLPFYPVVSRLRYYRIKKLAIELIKNEKIDALVCFCGYAESVYCGVKIKQIFKDRIKVVNYHLDILSQRSKKVTHSKILQKKLKKFLSNEFRTVDAVLLPESFENKWDLNGTLHFVGFPVCLEFDDEAEQYDAAFSRNVINVVYIGSMDSINRNPDYVLKMISFYNSQNEKKIHMHVWGMIDDQIRTCFERNDCVSYRGVIESKYSMSILKQADFILNIGNAVTPKMLPSKIFKSFLSGKPILNFVKNENDESLSYFEEYGHSLLISELNSDESFNHQIFIQFIDNNSGKSFDVPKRLIEHNTPRYIVNKIEEVLNN